MSSTFGGLSTALSSLYAQRRGLDVTGQNIANANTEGYTRQRADMQSQTGAIVPSMWSQADGLGTGVKVEDIQRLRDAFQESRGRTEHGQNAYLANQTSAYAAIEDVFAEPSSTALQAQFQDMWASWSDVANNPDDLAARSALIQQSSTVADGLKGAHTALSNQWGTTRTQLQAFSDEVNTTAATVATLNDNIVRSTAAGLSVNELEDQRDLHLMHLAELSGATASKRPNGSVDVYLGGSTLVSGAHARQLQVTGATQLEVQTPATTVAVSWTDITPPNNNTASVGGTMGSMLDTMTTVLTTLSDDLDGVAAKLISTVNAQHALGFDLNGVAGKPFFSGATALDIAVAISTPDELAVSNSQGTFDPVTSTWSGAYDGTNGAALAAIGVSSTGPDRDYQRLIADLGVAAQTSGRRADIQSNVTLQVDSAREAESGVNLDEEMTNLLSYQRAYEAASRVMTTVDAMLDQLINRTAV